jgi:exopolysaccharide biosynthesis polyprenyl glycosylphosphotransferase
MSMIHSESTNALSLKLPVKKQVKGRKKNVAFIVLAVLLDLLLWVLLYLGITQLTGSYNIITLDSLLIPFGSLVLAMALVGAYRHRMDFASLRYASEHIIACCVAYLLSAFLLYVVASFGPNATSSRAIFTLSFVFFAPAALYWRRGYWFYSSRHRSQGKFLVIVDGDLGPIFYRDYLKNQQHQGVQYLASDYSLIGKPVAGEGSPELQVSAAHLLPQLEADNIAGYEAIVLASRFNHLDKRVLKRLGEIHFEELPVFLIESFYENYWNRISLDLIGPAWPLETDFALVQHSVYTMIKRLVDLIFASVVLFIVSPLMLIVSVLLLLLEGWPVIYSQQRTGQYQEPFTLFKFRSMKVGSDKGDKYTREGDTRVFPLGALLRKTRLDELPQLWNVLRGDMSMIGPRAEWVKLVRGYEQEIPHYHYRHLVRPGITGWAQVNYPYGASLEDTLQKFSYDLYYIRNFSLRLDAEVVLKTLHTMIFGKGQ